MCCSQLTKLLPLLILGLLPAYDSQEQEGQAEAERDQAEKPRSSATEAYPPEDVTDNVFTERAQCELQHRRRSTL
jgi:hypothetical protein